MLKSKEVDVNRIISNIGSLESSFKSAKDQLDSIPGIPLPSEENVKNMFSELRTKATSIKTEKDKKEFFKQYSLVARMCQSYIEAANDWQKIKEAGLDAIGFYLGIDENTAKGTASAILASAFIVAGIGPIKKIRDLKKLTNAEKISEIGKSAPNTAKALAKLNEKLAEYETKINEIIAKERAFLKSLAASSPKFSAIGLRSLEFVETYFNKPGVITYFKTCPNPNTRKQFILENIIDRAALVIKKTDPPEIRRKKEFIRDLVGGSQNYDKIIKKYIASGGTEREAVEILDQIKTRVRVAGHGVSNLWAKDIKNEVYHEIVHDFKNLFSRIDMFKDVLLGAMKK